MACRKQPLRIASFQGVILLCKKILKTIINRLRKEEMTSKQALLNQTNAENRDDELIVAGMSMMHR